MTINELREARNKAWQGAKAFVESKRDKDGLLSKEDAAAYDEMEKKIRSTFADVKMPANAAVREYVKVSDNKEPIVAIATDKELSGTSYDVFFKHDPVPMELRNTV